MTCLSLTSLDRKLQSIAISCTHNRYDPCVSMYDPHAHSIVVSDEKLYHFKADTQFSCSRFLFYIFGPAKTELKEMKDFWIYQITSLNY